MDENILKFRVGIFVLIAMCILGILIFLNSEGWVPQYTLFVKPPSAPGVTKGTPIRKNGILIGRVKSVTTEDDHVLIELRINQDERIYENEICSIGAESILGDAVVEFLPKLAADRGQVVGNDSVMNQVSLKRNPLEFIDMFAELKPELSQTLTVVQDSGRAVQEAGNGIRDLSETVQGVFENENSDVKALLVDLRNMSTKAQLAIDNFNRIFESANNIIGDPELKTQIKNGLAEIPKIFQEVRVTVTDARQAIQAFGDIPEGVNTNLENMQAFTLALKEQGPEVLAQVNQSLKNVDQFVSEVRQFTKSFEKLSQSEGTVGKLLNDTELYDQALETVRTIKESSAKIEPLINDLRMFADAIARDPGVIGVRGALDRRPSKTGYKGTPVGRDGGLFLK